MKLSVFPRFFVLLFLAGSPALAEELVFEKQNFAITKPEGWMEIPEAAKDPVVVSTGDPDRTNIVAVLTMPSPSKFVPFDESFARGFDKGFDNASGGKKLSGKFTTFKGLPAYERFGTMPVEGRTASSFVRVMLADDNFLLVQALDFKGNVADNTTIMQAADSFRFLRPVAPPRPAGIVGLLRNSFGEHGVAIAIVTVIGAAFVFALAGIVKLFKKKERKPGEPPPLR